MEMDRYEVAIPGLVLDVCRVIARRTRKLTHPARQADASCSPSVASGLRNVHFSVEPHFASDPARQVGPSASVSVFGQRGASPFRAYALRPVTEGNCVAARRGGKQLEVNDQSVTQVNSIRPCQSASLLGNGEARTGVIRKPTTLKGSVRKRSWGWWGGWRRNGRKARHMKQRDLSGPTGVHCPR